MYAKCEWLISTSTQYASCISYQKTEESNLAMGITQNTILYFPTLPLTICCGFERSFILFPQEKNK